MSDDAEREEVCADENEVCTPEDIRSEGSTNEGEEIDEHAEVVDDEVGNDGKNFHLKVMVKGGGRD